MTLTTNASMLTNMQDQISSLVASSASESSTGQVRELLNKYSALPATSGDALLAFDLTLNDENDESPSLTDVLVLIIFSKPRNVILSLIVGLQV